MTEPMFQEGTPGWGMTLSTQEEPLLRSLAEAERDAVVTAMRVLLARGNPKQRALVIILGISRHAVRRKLLKLGLSWTHPEVAGRDYRSH
jgi:DNA-binding protein Fis